MTGTGQNRHKRHSTVETYNATEEIFFVDGAEKPSPAQFPRHGGQGVQKRERRAEMEGDRDGDDGGRRSPKGVWVRAWQSLGRLRARFPESRATGWIQ